MAFCMNCGTEVPDGAKFCPVCGKPIIQVKSRPVVDQQVQAVSSQKEDKTEVQNVENEQNSEDYSNRQNSESTSDNIQNRQQEEQNQQLFFSRNNDVAPKTLHKKNNRAIMLVIVIIVAAIAVSCIVHFANVNKTDSPDNHLKNKESKTELNDTSDTDDEDYDDSDSDTPFNGKGSIEDTVIFDEKGVKITASNLQYGDSEATMDLELENDSKKDLSFVSGSIGYSCNSVNGYSVSSMYVNEDITAGDKASTNVSISYGEMQALGITDIAELEIGFQVETTDYKDYLITGPLKIETSSASSYDKKKDTYQTAMKDGTFEKATGYKVKTFKKDKFYSEEGIDLISAAIIDKDGNDDVILELKNTSDEVRHFGVGDFAINGLVVSSSDWTSETVNPGEIGALDVDIDNMLNAEEYATLNIGDIKNVSFHATINNSKGKSLKENDTVEIAFSGKKTKVDDSGDEIYDKNKIRIVYKGVSESDSIYYYVLLAAYNDTGKTIYVSDEYDTTSVNGTMVDETTYSTVVEPGQVGIMKYGITKSSLEDADIDTEDIKTIKFQLNIGSGSYYNYIATPKLTISKK